MAEFAVELVEWVSCGKSIRGGTDATQWCQRRQMHTFQPNKFMKHHCGLMRMSAPEHWAILSFGGGEERAFSPNQPEWYTQT